MGQVTHERGSRALAMQVRVVIVVTIHRVWKSQQIVSVSDDSDDALRSYFYDSDPIDADLDYVVGSTKHDCRVNTAAKRAEHGE